MFLTPESPWRLATRAVSVAFACVGLLASPPLPALSSIGTAEVSKAEGRPCFSIAVNPGADIRLYGMRVVDTTAERSDSLATSGEVWGFLIDDPGVPFRPGVDACVPYGRTPAGAHERQAPRPLVRDRIYRVNVNAKPVAGGTSAAGYTARFCVKGTGDADADIVVIPWDERQGRWRDDVC